MTRRGRTLVALLAFAAGMLVTLIALFVLDVPSAFAGDPQEPATVTVASGDTLSQYAERFAPAGEDHQEFVREMREINDLASPRITQGQHLELPEGSVHAA